MNIPKPKCKHCGSSPESATTVEGTSVTNDSCYGCRNRYQSTIRHMQDALSSLSEAQTLMEMEDSDTFGIGMGDQLGAAYSGLSGLLRHIEQRYIEP